MTPEERLAELAEVKGYFYGIADEVEGWFADWDVKHADHEDRLAALEAALTTVQADLDAAEADIVTLQADLDAAEATIVDHESRIDALEA